MGVCLNVIIAGITCEKCAMFLGEMIGNSIIGYNAIPRFRILP